MCGLLVGQLVRGGVENVHHWITATKVMSTNRTQHGWWIHLATPKNFLSNPQRFSSLLCCFVLSAFLSIFVSCVPRATSATTIQMWNNHTRPLTVSICYMLSLVRVVSRLLFSVLSCINYSIPNLITMTIYDKILEIKTWGSKAPSYHKPKRDWERSQGNSLWLNETLPICGP